MSKLLGVLALMLMAVPMAFAYVTGPMPIGIELSTEPFVPSIWGCDHWVMTDDPLETGRISNAGDPLVERMQSYIFTGEQLTWRVLVLDKNGIEKVNAPDGTVGGLQEVNCRLDHVLTAEETIGSTCNARLGEEVFIHPPAANTMAYYTCTVTAEPNMHGNKQVTIHVTDIVGGNASLAEGITYFFNPAISLTVDGEIDFGANVRPGTTVYSPSVVVRSNSEGGVLLDMFIAGTDFYDPTTSGALCSANTNKLALGAFRYYATNGAYSTQVDPRKDTEGYVPLNYCIGAECAFSRSFYDHAEIIQTPNAKVGPYYLGNELANGAGISMTFKLNLPVPCNGNFNSGGFYLMGEAI